MTNQHEIYRCNICGNVVALVQAGAGQLVCCGQPMEKLAENSTGANAEKHVPVADKNASGWTVKVGSEPHPMTAEHHIEWIEIIMAGKFCRYFLKTGEAAQAEFSGGAQPIKARAYCNLHGLWVK